jgi:hypothetical protein
MANMSWADRLGLAGAFLGFFGGYLIFAKGPAANPQQYWFRIAVAGVGIALGVAGLLMKLSGPRNPD